MTNTEKAKSEYTRWLSSELPDSWFHIDADYLEFLILSFLAGAYIVSGRNYSDLVFSNDNVESDVPNKTDEVEL